ncbi:uncharacterized protein LOC117109651, partial [Anneissia japonica]|uniref:uncharacterized protein LOC117109651 n=1 Tax=Anneissia japonica TaxID=1529436 RepID=UPI0014257628
MDTSKLVVTIPSDLQLTDDERSVLSKGLSFVPQRPKIDDFQALKDLEQFYRKLKLKANFHNQPLTSTDSDDGFSNLRRNHSEWTPPTGRFPALDLYINKCRHDINKNVLKQRSRSESISVGEKKALSNLRNNSDLIIKPADKGGATVVWRKDLYICEGNRQLSDRNTYISVPFDHKDNSPGRPIVSTCNCPTVIISEYLDSVLSPIVKKLPTYINDTNDAIRTFKGFEFTGRHKYVFTMDITSLYTSIPIADGLTAVRHFLDHDNHTSCSTSTIIRLAELVLKTTSFEFN